MIGQLLDGRYKIIESLSAGGFGHTYIAENNRIPGNPKCVVKHLKPANSDDPNILMTARRLFHSEAEALAKLGDRNNYIPRIFDFFEEGEQFYLVEEFIEGHPLSQELMPGEQLSEFYIIALLEGILPVLEFIHQQDVIHRDIKPANIIRCKHNGKLFLIDFGAVKQVRSPQTNVPNQASATVSIGTPGYMPTEQGRGKPRPNSDLYALGMIGIQALTGLYPCDLEEDPETGDILWQHRASVSPELAAILTRMVRYHFKNRYSSATEVLQALQQLMPSMAKTALATVAANTLVHKLTLEWVEAGQVKTKTIRNEDSKNPGTVRIGRDPAQCNIVLSHPTVSGLHAEIFFNPQQQRFYLRSLREQNPPVVDGQTLLTGEVALSQSSIRLGKVDLRVTSIALKQYTTGYITEYSPQQILMPPQQVAPTVLPRSNGQITPVPLPTSPPLTPTPSFPSPVTVSSVRNKLLLLIGVGIAALLVSAIAAFAIQKQTEQQARVQATLEAINTVKTNGKYSECVDKARDIPQSSEIYDDAQDLLKECQLAIVSGVSPRPTPSPDPTSSPRPTPSPDPTSSPRPTPSPESTSSPTTTTPSPESTSSPRPTPSPEPTSSPTTTTPSPDLTSNPLLTESNEAPLPLPEVEDSQEPNSQMFPEPDSQIFPEPGSQMFPEPDSQMFPEQDSQPSSDKAEKGW